jgi:hypothetical protein
MVLIGNWKRNEFDANWRYGLGLFKKKREVKKTSQIEFSTVAKKSYDQNSILKP